MKRKILLGLTGSVATALYDKLIEQLSELGKVEVIVTEKAYHFIRFRRLCDVLEKHGASFYMESNEWTWERGGALSKKWEKGDEVLHIKLRDEASALVIAPCSANTLAKLANGLCDNLLTTVARAWDFNRPFIVAPAMNTNMWNHPVTDQHLSKLSRFGCRLIEPQEKMLACGTMGVGAMADIYDIVTELSYALCWEFPLDECSGIPVGNHPGAFGTQRKHERHTGVDLYTYDGARVTAVEDGVVVGIEHFTGEWDNSPWWNNTDCILIEGASGVVCYGEVTASKYLQVGERVVAGNCIGYVTRVLKDGKERPDIPGHSTSMLHMELYPHGTRKASAKFEDSEDILRDPTQYLQESHCVFELPNLVME